MRQLVVFALWFVAACGRGPERPPAQQAAPSGDARFACVTDADCTNSCSLGAVNAAWYAAAGVDECEDGCADADALPARCDAGGCVAFWRNPATGAAEQNVACTRKR